MAWIWLIALFGCALDAPVIDAPESVLADQSINVTVTSNEGADTEYWWFLDGVLQDEHTNEIDGPHDGDEWTLVVRQSKGLSSSPIVSAVIDIEPVDAPPDDTGELGGPDSTDDTGGFCGLDTSIGSSPDCPAQHCSDMAEWADQPGLYWFEAPEGSRVTEPYKALCKFTDSGAWMQVLTFNEGADSDIVAHVDNPIWDVDCSYLQTGVASKALLAWEPRTGFVDHGINPGACAIAVQQVLMCPYSDDQQYPCYRSPMVASDAQSLQASWSGSGSNLRFGDTGGSEPNPVSSTDFMGGSECELVPEPIDGDPPVEAAGSVEWNVGTSVPRIGFEVSVWGTDVTYGVGLRSEFGYSSGYYSNTDPSIGCNGALSVWVR